MGIILDDNFDDDLDINISKVITCASIVKKSVSNEKYDQLWQIYQELIFSGDEKYLSTSVVSGYLPLCLQISTYILPKSHIYYYTLQIKHPQTINLIYFLNLKSQMLYKLVYQGETRILINFL